MEIAPGESIVVVAATGSYTRPLPANCVELPWHADRHRVTGLYKRCVVVCDWLVEVDPSMIEDVAGITPPSVLHRILAQLPDPGTTEQ